MDHWFDHQWRMSPLRTYNATEADIIVVPVALPVQDVASQASYFDDARSDLEYAELLQQRHHHCQYELNTASSCWPVDILLDSACHDSGVQVQLHTIVYVSDVHCDMFCL